MLKDNRAKIPCRGVPCQSLLLLALAIAGVALYFNASPAWADQPPRQQTVLRVGFSAQVFPEVDQRDVQVAMQLWTRELARGSGFDAEPRTIVYNRTEDLLAAVKKGELIVVSLPALDYLQIRSTAPMAPAFVSFSNTGRKRQFILLVRRDSGIRSVRDLRGKCVLLPSRKKNYAGHIWLDVLLRREGIRESSTFFRQVKESSSSSQAIMGVFFKKVDAAIVNRGTLETSATLNPQVGSQLSAIAESRSMLGDITCIPDNVSESMKHAIQQAALHLHETAAGKQMFTLFQMDRAIPFQPSHLEGLEDLLRERDRLAAKWGQRR
jgi:ABC-type phosphate/phosphonate transport system substrate-binding protein